MSENQDFLTPINRLFSNNSNSPDELYRSQIMGLYELDTNIVDRQALSEEYRLDREFQDTLNHINRHSESHNHRHPHGSPEPRSLAWIMRKINLMDAKINVILKHIDEKENKKRKNKKEKIDNELEIINKLRKIVGV